VSSIAGRANHHAGDHERRILQYDARQPDGQAWLGPTVGCSAPLVEQHYYWL
jgi:hypothetical protein